MGNSNGMDARPRVLRKITKEEYEAFIDSATPDKKCTVCGHDEFGILMDGDHTATFTLPSAPMSPLGPPRGLPCYCYVCKKCGTITLTAAHIVVESING